MIWFILIGGIEAALVLYWFVPVSRQRGSFVAAAPELLIIDGYSACIGWGSLITLL